MVVILVETEHHPEDRAAARAAIAEVARLSRAEPGCLSYAVAVDLEDPAVTRVSELWAGVEQHREHMAQPHVAAFFAAIRGLRVARRVFRAFEIAGPLDLSLPIDQPD
jgi:quinol monooxygenase YgiN